MAKVLHQDAIVLAGGFGTRLRAVVSDVPKPMAPVAGRPFLDYLLQSLAAQGVQRVILSTGHMAHLIENRYSDGFMGMSVTCVHESSPLGTGGAIRKAMSVVQSEWALVLNGDTWLDMPYGDFVRKSVASDVPLSIVTRMVPDASRYGCCTIREGQIIAFGEKNNGGPGFINAGVYAMRKNVFDRFNLPEAFSFEHDFLREHLPALTPMAYPANGYFIDIGIPEDYARAQIELPAHTMRQRPGT